MIFQDFLPKQLHNFTPLRPEDVRRKDTRANEMIWPELRSAEFIIVTIS